MLRYLSLAWIEALTDAVAASPQLADLARSHAIGITQEITDGPEGTVVYHLQAGDGRATFGAGPADPQDVGMIEDWATAVAVATGTLTAQEAFVTGRIRLTGDQSKLIEAQPVFAALSSVFAEIAPRTEYR